MRGQTQNCTILVLQENLVVGVPMRFITIGIWEIQGERKNGPIVNLNHVVRVRRNFIIPNIVKIIMTVWNHLTTAACRFYCILVVPDGYKYCSWATFARDYKSADCILFDDDFCKEKRPPILLSGGLLRFPGGLLSQISFHPDHEFANTAESVSIRKGCRLTLYTGEEG